MNKITVHYELREVDEKIIQSMDQEREFRTMVQQWLNELWLEKDAFLDQLIAKQQ